MIHDFTQQKSIITQFVSELRNVETQNNKEVFRKNLSRIGQFLAYEVSKHVNYKQQEIQTPLIKTQATVLAEQPVIATILRAGLPLHQGVLECFPDAENAFVSAYRKTNANKQIDYIIEYISSPSLENKTLMITDPMLATGLSMIQCLEKMIAQKGTPKHIHIISVIASQEAITRIAGAFPQADIWCAAIDADLNAKQYIVPGLGDAGDLAYGARE